MKKWIFIFLGALLLSVGVVSPAHAAVNDFTISRYDIALTLSRDSEQRSILTTRETITAEFPNFDQNHGIERFIPKEYQNHPTSLNIVSVQNQAGTSWNHTTYDSGDYTVLRIGDADSYVHGPQTFVIEYTQRDVTADFPDTGGQEFYWDTNGTEWRVPITALNVSLKIDESLWSSLTGNKACYFGSFGSAEACEITSIDGVYETSATNLSSGDNITIAVGFVPGTFAEYKQSLWSKIVEIWGALQFVGIFVAGLITILLFVRYSRWSNRRHEIDTIIPEYLPPKGTSVQVSAVVARSYTTFAAQLIDFAVRHYIKIYEVKEKKFFSAAEYELEIIKPITDLAPEEQEILTDIFGATPTVGMKFNTKDFRKNYAMSARFTDNPRKLEKLIKHGYGIRAKDPAKSAWFKKTGYVLLIIGVLLINISFLIAAFISFLLAYSLYPMTEKGLALARYLEGLKLYIKVAEEDRLKMLQSPEGAVKVKVDSKDPKQLVKLYEKVLPYAILFGQEKQWNKQLGQLYETTSTQPNWYAGRNMAAFHAASFSSAMSNMTSSINTSGAASSSTGGSSGGGSSGGGGGGGGGGGW